jgi:3-oxoacyl-[acyl-carrier-protein] synthase II
MGEEASGVDAVRIALSRLIGGTGDIFLVGGAFNAEREDMLLLFEMGGALLHGPFAPVWSRTAQGGGLVLGSLASFLVIEEKAHALARGARPYARLTAVHSGRSRRNPGDVTAAVAEHLDALGPLDPASAAVISGAVGAEPATSEERAALAGRGLAVRATASLIGAGIEAQFPANVALAAMALSNGTLFPPTEQGGIETPLAGPLKQVAVTSVGHWRGEAAALVEAVN